MMFFGDISRDTSPIIRPDDGRNISRNVVEKHLSLEMSPKNINIMIQDMINSENSMNRTESTNTNIFKEKMLINHLVGKANSLH